MALTMLRDRCGWMGTNAQLSLLILGIPDDCENRQFQEAVQAACGPWAEPGSEEEPFESWLDHANDVLYQWRHISERERRRRLVESLGGPALNLMCGLLDENPHMTAHECLVALVQVFGNKDTRTAARMKFMTCTQQPQETLFAYVMHLEGLLQTAMEKRAIHPTLADQVRTRQVLMWAHPNKTLQSKLRRMGLERRPPGFMGMLRLVRETETWEAILAGIHHFQMEEDALAALAHAEVSKAGPGTADPGEAAPETCDATGAAPATEEPTKASPATQEDENAPPHPPTPADLGHPGPSEALSGPAPADMGSASGEGHQEAEDEDGTGEMSPPRLPASQGSACSHPVW
uniref:PNMA family member 6F n=1 Tax=Rhinolophus ferrumequinum TaxID=59479 RepID=A0A671E9J6_RHIFE